MATQTVILDVGRTSGTFTADVFPDASSTAFATGVTVTADSVSGFYTLSLTSSAGLYRIIFKEAGIRIGSFYVTTLDAAATYIGHGTRGEARQRDWVGQTGDSFARIGVNGSGLTALGDSRLSNLDAAISSLNNLSALMNIYGSPLLEIPDTGSTLFAFTVVVRDNEGKLVNLDTAPTITAANAAGTSRSANLSAISSPATGRYTFTYTVTSTAAEESLRITCSGAVSAENRYIEWVGAVVNYDSLTALAAIQSKTDLIQPFPTNFAALGINSSGHISRVVLVDTTTTNTDMRGTNGANTVTPPTVAEIRAEMDVNSSKLTAIRTNTQWAQMAAVPVLGLIADAGTGVEHFTLAGITPVDATSVAVTVDASGNRTSVVGS